MKKYIIFLQPINNTLEVVRAAKAKGYDVIALVSQEIPSLPPYGTALSCVDHFIYIDDWDDYDSVIKKVNSVIKDGCVVGTYFGIEPVAVLNAKLRENYNLLGNTVDTVRSITNKLIVRKTLNDAGLSNLKYSTYEDFSKWITWPTGCVYYFKPTYGSGSLCVKRCSSLEDIKIALDDWNKYSNTNAKSDLFLDKYHVFSDKDNPYYLEQEIKGELLSVEGICHNGEFHSLGLLSRILFSENPVVEMGSCFPYPHPEKHKILQKVSDAHKALGIKFGATHTELIIGSDGQIEIIDLNPRFVGADVIMSINNAYGISIQDTLLEIALGNKPSIHINSNHKFSCLQYVLPPANFDVFNSIHLPNESDVAFSRVCIPSGTKFLSTDTQSDMLGGYLVVSDSFDGAIKRSYQLRNKIVINGKLPGRF